MGLFKYQRVCFQLVINVFTDVVVKLGFASYYMHHAALYIFESGFEVAITIADMKWF